MSRATIGPLAPSDHVAPLGYMGDDDIEYAQALTKVGRDWCERWGEFYGMVGGRQLYSFTPAQVRIIHAYPANTQRTRY